MIIRYPSCAALAKDYEASVPAHKRQGPMSSSWYNDESPTQTLSLTYGGDTCLVPSAEHYLNKLDLSIETPRKVWKRAPIGARCSIPDYLADLPTPMRNRVTMGDEHQPITILACTTSSAGISAKTLQTRGTVILALVMALSRVRPVILDQLTILDGNHEGETIITSTINTSPLDLATACYVLTSAGFARRLTYGLAKVKNQFGGRWPRGFSLSNPDPYYKTLIPKLGLRPEKTLIIGAATLGDELLETPLLWINKQIQRFTAHEEAET